MTLCPVCNSERVKSRSAQQKMYARAKSRAKIRGHDFDLSLEDIVIPEVCPILGIPLEVQRGRSGAFKNSPSLDRIDNDKGYVKGNIRVISQLANAMKSSANREELVQFALWVLKERDLT